MFDEISQDWNRKRSKPWKPFTQIADSALTIWKEKFNIQEQSNIFLDLGAGNGRNASFFMKWTKILIELDISFKMLTNNKNSNHKIHASMQKLPFRNDVFSGIFSIAAFHHIEAKNNRLDSIKEIKRIGKNKAIFGITVWRFYQKKFIKQYINQLLEKEGISNPKLEIGDVIVPWVISQGNVKKRVKRFYHLFRISDITFIMKHFKKIFKYSFGNKTEKTNFAFFGSISKTSNS